MARSVLRGGILVANAMLLSSLAFLICSLNSADITYINEFRNYAATMRDLTFAVAFETVFGSAIIEEISHSR